MKKERIIKTIKKIDKRQIIAGLILLLVASLSIGYSAFSSKLSIEGVALEVRIKKDVRVTGVKVSNLNAEAGGISLYEEYGVDFIEGQIELPNEDTKVIYDVSITNIGNVDVGILELNNLPDNLGYKILNYNLKDKICNESGTCKLGITKDIQIEIGYKEGMYNGESTTFDFKMDFNFQQFYTITYTNIEDVTNYPKEVLGGDTLVIENMVKGIGVKQDDVTRDFVYEEGTLTVENVEGNLEIIKKDFTLLDGQTFNQSIKQLSSGNSNDTHSTSNTIIKKVVFLTNGELPEGYTEESLKALKSRDVSVKQDKAIMAYYDNEAVYVYSEGEIQANVDSGYLFNYLSNLTGIEGLNTLDTSQVTSLYQMFFECSNLTSLDLSNLDTSQVTDMASMFSGCSSLTSLDLSNFDTSQVTNMLQMFWECTKITKLDLSNFDTSAVTKMQSMFKGCESLTSLDLSNFDTSQVTRMYYMFGGCISLKDLNLSSFDTSQVTDMQEMFTDCKSLTYLNLSNFDVRNVTRIDSIFKNCTKLESLNMSGLNFENITRMPSLFRGLSSLTTLDLSNFNTSQVTDMSYMFAECKSLISLDLGSFDTSQVTNMSSMFQGCMSLTSLDLSSFDTSQVTNMSSMFYGCMSLTSLDLSSFNTSKVRNMSYMFYNCRELTNIEFRQAIFSSSRYTSMFYNIPSVTVIVKDETAQTWLTSKFSNVNAVIYSA